MFKKIFSFHTIDGDDMKSMSIWQDIQSTFLNPVSKNMNVDVLIIGGGVSGLSVLYQLKDSSLKTILVERGLCGYGVTSKSTAKITYLQGSLLEKIRKFHGEDIASRYLQAERDGVFLLQKIIKKEKIFCDLESSPSYLFCTQEENFERLQKEYDFLLKNQVKVVKTRFQDKPALKIEDSYTFHPLKYIQGLKKLLKEHIFENSKVEKIVKKDSFYEVLINGYTIKAKKIVLATHYPYFLKPFLFPFKNHVETSYVVARKEDNPSHVNAINIDESVVSLRYYQDYLIYLFHSETASKRSFLKERFEKFSSWDYEWTNKDVITNDYIPFIGSLSKQDDSFLFLGGYGTWGFSNATIGSVVIKDILFEKHNPYISLFAPYRKLKFERLLTDSFCTIEAIVKSTKNNVNNQEVIYKKIDNQDVAIYIDENKKEHIVLNRCPHMKCGLIFNPLEKTWDCLCHGSRFSIDGKCIEGSSNLDISFKK